MSTDTVAKFAWDAAIRWGVGVVVLAIVSITIWNSFDNQNEFIRNKLMDASEKQTQVISQNGEQLKQNSDVLERVIEQLDK